jgi:hypothetical protein
MRAAVAVMMVAALVPAITAQPAAAVQPPQSTLPSANPIDNTPRVTNGQVKAIVRAGDRVYVGGSFTTVQNGGGGTNQTRNRLFSYRHSTGQLDAWNPNMAGNVEALALSPDGQWLYVGGFFTSAGGSSAPRVERYNTSTGARDGSFNPNVNGGVTDIQLRGNVLYVGGNFTAVNGTARGRLAAINATTGATLALNTPLGDPWTDGTAPNVKKLDVTPAGDRLVAVGNFRNVAGLDRPQLVVVDLDRAGGGAVATDFRTGAFGVRCASAFDTYMRDVEFSPDGSWFGVNTTGAWNGTSTYCDTTTRFETRSTGDDVRPTWADYTGGDTLYGIAITDAAVYVGGHQRWQNNSTPPGGDQAGPGAVGRSGIAALDPLTGVPLSWNPGKERGVGTFELTTTSDALLIGHDTSYVAGELRPRLSGFPMTTASNPAPDRIGLPVTQFQGRSDGTLRRGTLDGSSVTGVGTAPAAGINWSQLRGAFVQRGQLYAWGLPGGTFTRRSFDGTSVGSATDLIAAAGYTVAPPNNLTNVRAAAYRDGRIFYLRDGDSRLYWRWFSLQSGIVGASEFIASAGNWTSVTGIEIAGSWLYSTRTDGRLYRSYVSGGSVQSAGPVLVDATTNWNGGNDLFFTGLGNTIPDPPPPGDPGTVNCAADEWRAEYFSNTTLSGLPEAVRCEGEINSDWGTGSPPDVPVGPDQFSIRWTRTLAVPTAGTYTFAARADDGIRVDVDGVRILDEWRDQAPTDFSVTRDLAAGNRQVVVQYYENGGGAEARLSITREGGEPPPPPPPPPPVECTSEQWKAEYFANTTLTGDPATVRCESAIDNDWGTGAPAGTAVGADQFSVRWTRTLTVATAGSYTFAARADDGIRVDVDGVRILDEWRDQGPTDFSVTRDLAAGDRQVVVQYYENVGGAEARLSITRGSDPPPPPPVGRIGLVVPDPASLGSDALLRDRLAAGGDEVVVLDDNVVDAAAVASLDAVVISGRIQAGAIGTRLNGSTAPMVVNKAWWMDDARMTVGGTAQGTTTGTTVTITDPASPLAGGLSGDVSVYSSAATLGFGTPTAGGTTTAVANGRAAVWAYSPGAVMALGTVAAGCRIALPYEGDVAARLTAAGWTLFDAAVARARSTACDV